MTTTDINRGHIRHDGYIFLGYDRDRKRNLREKWCSPEAWEKRKLYQQKYHKTYRKKSKCDPS